MSDMFVAACNGWYSPLQAKSEARVDTEKSLMQQQKLWVVHKDGFSLASTVQEEGSPQPLTALLSCQLHTIPGTVSVYCVAPPFLSPSSSSSCCCRVRRHSGSS